MKDNRENWNLINLTNRTLTTGFPNVRAIGPGKSTDLLSSLNKEQVRQSKGIALLLSRGWAKIEIIVDGTLVRTVTIDNIDDLNDSTLSVTLDSNGDGNIDFQGSSINLNNGTGTAGGNLNLDGGTVVFNNDASLSATGSVISANSEEVVTAGDMSVFGDFSVYGVTTLKFTDKEPNLTENGTLAIYQDGNSLVLKARGKDGKVFKTELGTFE